MIKTVVRVCFLAKKELFLRIEAVHYPTCVRNADITIMSTEMKIKLRSSFSTEGRRMAGARALWVANGMKKEQFGKPIIAIANSFTQFVPGHTHLHEAGQLVKKEIENRHLSKTFFIFFD